MALKVKTQLKRNVRDRYYSSMNYEQYCQIFGPPSPIIKPLDDPTQDIPELCLQLQANNNKQIKINNNENKINKQFSPFSSESQQMEQEVIEVKKNEVSKKTSIVSTNQTSPKVQFRESPPRIVNQRLRARSDNSQYLIFNFLERINQKGKKKIKTQ